MKLRLRDVFSSHVHFTQFKYFCHINHVSTCARLPGALESDAKEYDKAVCDENVLVLHILVEFPVYFNI